MLKTTAFWLNTKSKFQKLIHVSISHSHASLPIPPPLPHKKKKIKCIIVYGLLSWIILLFIYICGTFCLLSICHGFFFFLSCIYLCFFFFFGYIGYLFFLNYHIVMVINNKLVIGYEILKIIPTQSQSYRTLYTAPNCTCDCKIEMLCSDGFSQTAPQSAVLKMTQNCTTNTPSY